MYKSGRRTGWELITEPFPIDAEERLLKAIFGEDCMLDTNNNNNEVQHDNDLSARSPRRTEEADPQTL